MANYYTTTQLQLTRNYLDGGIRGEFLPSRQVEDNGDQVTQFTTGIQTGDGFDTVRYETGLGEDNFKIGYSEAISCEDGDVRLGQFGDEVDALTNYRPFSENLSGASGPGGTTFPTEKVSGFPYDSFGIDSSTVEVVTFTGFPYDTQGLDAGGVNYAEAVGLDSSIFDVANNIAGSADPGGDDI